MPPDAVMSQPPETKPCERCGVQIHAASGYCTLCGTAQRTPRRPGRWLVAGAMMAAVSGSVLAATLSGGSAEARFRLYQTPGLVTLVPAGWSGGLVAGPAGVSRLVFADPADARRRLTVVSDRQRRASALRRGRVVRTLARLRADYRERLFARVRLSDGRPAWLLSYDSGGTAHAVYVFSACVPTVAMTVELRAPLPDDPRASLGSSVPASAKPRCSGPSGP